MDDGIPQVPLRAVVGRLDILPSQEDEQTGAVLLIAPLQASRLALGRQRRAEDQPVGGLRDQDPPPREGCRADPIALVVQPQRPPEHVAQRGGPDSAGRPVGLDGIGQVAELMAQADLVRPGRGAHLRRPQVRAPDLRLGPSQERVDHVPAPARPDHVVAGVRRLEHPVPVRAPIHAGAGLVRVDHRPGSHLLSERLIGGACPLRQPPQRVGDRPLADPQPEHVPAHRLQPLVPEVVRLAQVAQQRLDPGPEAPPRLEAGGVGRLRPRPARRAARRVPPRLDHRRPGRR
jgi:hypothetical protein